MADVVFAEAFNLLEDDTFRYVIDAIESSNVRIGVLVQATEASTWRIDRWLFPRAIEGRNAFVAFVTRLVEKRLRTAPLKRNDVFSYLLGVKDDQTNQGLRPVEIAAESTTMIVAGTECTLLLHLVV